MGPKKRDRVEIIGDILQSIQNKNGQIKPTHLMYKANLSHRQLKKYVEELRVKKLIDEIIKTNQKYITITHKGCQFLTKLREMKEFEDMFRF